MKPQVEERRKKSRSVQAVGPAYKLTHQIRVGVNEVVAVKLLDLHETGCGLEVGCSLEIGTQVVLSGDLFHLGDGTEARAAGKVTWCRLRSVRTYRAGIEFHEPLRQPGSAKKQPERENPTVEEDYYEVLQLSSNADFDTIHRIYRILAQRFHPDNTDSGNTAMFRRVLEAYRVLSDPEKRAAYDVEHSRYRRVKWKIFDQTSAVQGAESEKRKRHAVLSLLYAKKLNDPDKGGLNPAEMEDLLGIPREHLDFTFWFLRESGFLSRTDNGKYSITIRGVNEVESEGGICTVPSMRPNRMIPSGEKASAA